MKEGQKGEDGTSSIGLEDGKGICVNGIVRYYAKLK
jgi:hypothetical protein